MVKVVVSDGTCEHTGSACTPVAGTVTVGSNSFVFVESNLVMVDDGTLEVPSHLAANCVDSDGPHSYVPDTLQQGFVFIEDKLVVLDGDSYAPDLTTIDSPGSNSIVDVVP